MKTYCVGGAVRDSMLGLPVRDRDYVVVGATPEDMEQLGFRPVGKDFPVFLHPRTHEEYALARTERKVARGYKGFSVHAAPDVTLEQDLARRDLTINAMAREEMQDGDGSGAGDDSACPLIDPYGGARDLHDGVLRHVSPAFVEDPVRILRVARFAARFGFKVADETMALMRRMVDEGEADALVPERVWQEFSKGLMEDRAPRMFEVLASCGLLVRLFKECDFAFEPRQGDQAAADNDVTACFMHALEFAVRQAYGIEVRFALLGFALKAEQGEQGKSREREAELKALAARLRAPGDCRDAALLALHQGMAAMMVHEERVHEKAAAGRLAILEASDAFRRPERLRRLIETCECAQYGAQRWVEQPWPPRIALAQALTAARGVDAAAVAAAAVAAAGTSASKGTGDIAAALRRARTQALQAVVVS